MGRYGRGRVYHGKPWLGLNPNFTEINVASQIDDPASILHHYRKLIELRKSNDTVVYGDYFPILPEHPRIFAYERRRAGSRIVVIANFSGDPLTVDLPEAITGASGTCLVTNHDIRTDLLQKWHYGRSRLLRLSLSDDQREPVFTTGSLPCCCGWYSLPAPARFLRAERRRLPVGLFDARILEH